MDFPYQSSRSNKVTVELPEVPVALRVPTLMVDSFKFIQTHGLVEGILRISGSVKRINKLYECGSLTWFHEPYPLPHDISGVLKRSLRNFDNHDIQGQIAFHELVNEFRKWRTSEKLKGEAGEKQDIQLEQPETVECDEENAETNKVKVDNGETFAPSNIEEVTESNEKSSKSEEKATEPEEKTETNSAEPRDEGASDETDSEFATAPTETPKISLNEAFASSADLSSPEVVYLTAETMLPSDVESMVLVLDVNFYRLFAVMVCSKWSQTRLHVFIFVVCQLHRLLSEQEKTKMSSTNLSIIFQPYLLNSDLLELMPELQNILQIIIEDYPTFIENIPLYTLESSTSIITKLSEESVTSPISSASSTDSIPSPFTGNTSPLKEETPNMEEYKKKQNRFSFLFDSYTSPVSKRFSIDYFSRSKSTSEPLTEAPQLRHLPVPIVGSNSVSLDQVPQLRDQTTKQQKRKSFMNIFTLPYVLTPELAANKVPDIELPKRETRNGSNGLRESFFKRTFSMKRRPSMKQRHTDGDIH